MKDREFLISIHSRLEHVHKEDPLTDYMHRLRGIILCMDADLLSSSTMKLNSMSEVLEALAQLER